ncbi:MAG: polysaccharide deacetylase family protein [Acidimicrobiales bacterium]
MTRVVWWIRGRMPAEGRARLRRVADRALRPIGSISAVVTGAPLIGLTFDDGPDPASTPAILDVLDQYGARATFFVLGDRAAAHPALVARILAEGHEIGLHGADHRRLTHMRLRFLAAHLRRGVEQLSGVTGVAPRYLRPPYGAQSVASYVAARRAGLDVVMWSAEANDWRDDPVQVIADRVAERVDRGDILLLHDAFVTDPAHPEVTEPDLDRAVLLKSVLEELATRGLHAVSVSELRASGTAKRTAWLRP